MKFEAPVAVKVKKNKGSNYYFKKSEKSRDSQKNKNQQRVRYPSGIFWQLFLTGSSSSFLRRHFSRALSTFIRKSENTQFQNILLLLGPLIRSSETVLNTIYTGWSIKTSKWFKRILKGLQRVSYGAHCQSKRRCKLHFFWMTKNFLHCFLFKVQARLSFQ